MDARAREVHREDLDQRSLPRLLADFTRDTTALLQDEVALVRSEASEKISQVGDAVGSLAVGGAILFAGFLILLISASIALNLIWGPYWDWLGPLIVGGVVAIIGWIVLASARSRLRAQSLKPRRTVEELRRDRDLIREQVR